MTEQKSLAEMNTLTATITPDTEQMLKQEPFNLELEMLQADREVLENGMIHYVIPITDTHKIFIVREFILKVISRSMMPVSPQ